MAGGEGAGMTARPVTDERCTWTEDCGDWATACGRYFRLNDGAPADNGIRYCCFCGRPLVEPEDGEENSDD